MPADVVESAARVKRSGLPPLVQQMLARMMAPGWKEPKPAGPKPAGLWPRDDRGQYVSAKPTSKRNRKAVL